jgi:serine dehydrogenase proteinase
MNKTANPKNSNEFIEQQLHGRAEAMGKAFNSDILAFYGPLIGGVDDHIRSVIEDMRRGSQRRTLTVVVSTLGGYIEVVQRIVDTIRYHYRSVNFVVPNSAFSAGTVLVMSGDAIYMNYYSRLGPIDPQVDTNRRIPVPALGYLIAWERLLKKAADGNLTDAEAQLMVEGFDQAELYKYEQARNLSITLLRRWLARFKFRDWKKTQTRRLRVTRKMKDDRAEMVAKILNDTDRWHTHGHGISMEVLRRELKLRIDDYGDDPALSAPIENYNSLQVDYMGRRSFVGVIHAPGTYLPFMSAR